MITLVSGVVEVRVDPLCGGRVASMRIDGREMLVTGGPDDPAMAWGAFPMVPWAGRVRRGRFSVDGRTYPLALTMPPHAIHGTGFSHPWTVEDDGSLRLELDEGWPFGGVARQWFDLDDTRLVCTLEVAAADRPMPAQVGWHPWFVKPDELRFDPSTMYLRDGEGIPSGDLVPPPDGPWDDCFTGVSQPVVLVYAGLTLDVSSTCDHWVVYDQPAHATCVEPQSGPPDAFNLAPEIVEPGRPLRHSMTVGWKLA